MIKNIINDVYIDNSKIINIELNKNHKRKIHLEDGRILSVSECKNLNMHCFCHDCKKIINGSGSSALSMFTLYKLDVWPYKNIICSSCELHKNPRVHVWTDEERKVRSEMYKGSKNPMYNKSIKDHMTLEKCELWKKHVKENACRGEKNGMYGRSVESIVGHKRWQEIVEKRKRTNSNKSIEEKAIISEKLRNAQKRYAEKHPEEYKQMKSKAGKITATKPASYEMNNLEKKVNMWLSEHNVSHEFSPILHCSKYNKDFQFDFIIHNKRILIECNGTYWHADKRFYNKRGTNGKKQLNDIQINKLKYDKMKKECAKFYGFKLITLWEYDVENGNFKKLEKELSND